jgi:DNA-binding protein H-NS
VPANSLVAIAKSKATANRMAKSLDVSDLKKVIDHLQAALVATKKREAKKAATKQAADLRKLKAMMAKMELSAVDVKKLMATPPKRKAAGKKNPATGKTGPRKGKKVAPKYQLKVDKEIHKWTGRGRMPLVFKAFVEKGGSLERCLIK